jgi:hypothetical protein
LIFCSKNATVLPDLPDFVKNPLKVEDDWIKDYAMEEGTYDITAVD